MSAVPETQLLAFDLDGTLVPTMDAFAEIAAEVIASRRGWAVEEARKGYIETCGNPFAQQLEVLFPGHEDNGAAAEEFEQRKLRVFYGARMDPAVRYALHLLRDAGYRLAVSSNNYESLVHGMIRREAPGVFEQVLGYREGFAKGPAHFDALLRGFGVRPQQCLFIGDSLSDLDKARAAEMPFVAIAGTFSRADFVRRDPAARVLTSVAELPQLLETHAQAPIAEPVEDMA